jgi:TonB-linked SusC/RagA family outer membrane protein
MKENKQRKLLWRQFLLSHARLFTVGILLLFQLTATAQEKKISGTVTGPGGEAMGGVTVALKGTTVGTLTDFEGKFSLSAPSGAVLSFSFIGMNTQEIPLGSSTVYNITMAENVTNLDEVVVIGYGTQKKISVTGAVVAVNGVDLVKSPNSGITNTLAGRVTGITTVQYTGVPGGSDPEIYVRGVGSLSSSASRPLMLVDGVEREFAQIDPNEIESVSILKDASATAVYGIRGANGVIIVTTKRGIEGAPKISITSQAGFQWPTYMFDMVDSYTYATHYNLAQKNDDPNISDAGLRFSPTALASFQNGKYPSVYPNQDWTDVLVKPAAFQEQQNINITGGSKIVKYFISLGNFFQDGAFKTPGQSTYGWNYTRYNYRANIDIDATESTKLSLTIGGRSEKRQAPGSRSFEGDFTDVLYSTPFSGIYMDGKRYWAQSKYIPSWADGLTSIGYGTGYQTRLSNPINLDIALLQKLDKVTKGLSWRIKVSNNSTVRLDKTRTTSMPAYGAYFRCDLDPTAVGDSTIVERKSGSVGLLGYSESAAKSRNWYMETALTYDRDFGLNHFTGLLLYNCSKNPYPSQTSYSDIPTGYVGTAARITYSYNLRYMMEVNMGYNGSENFVVGKRFGFFPSASLGWVLSEENFMQSIPGLDYFKLRFSYGVVGSDLQGNNRFLYLPTSYSLDSGYGANPSGGIHGYSFGTSTDVLQKYATEGKIGNPNVTWERANKQNYGIDIHAFNGLSISMDYFHELRNNILTTRSAVPGLLAMSLPAVNLGKVKNQGYEIELRWRSKIGQVNYNIGGNMSYAKNKILYMDEPPRHDPYLVQTGKSVGAQFGYVFDGFYNADEISAGWGPETGAANPNFNVKPGDVKYRDLNGDYVIDSFDQMVIGYPDYPEYNFAISGGFDYKGFDLSFLINGVTNCSRGLNSGFRFNFGVTYERGLMQYMADNDWTPETAATASWPRMSLTSMTYNANTSSLYLKDASYLRLKNLEIGYTLQHGVKRLGISSMRIFANGFDLLTFSKLKLIDPEQKADQAQYPLLEIVNLGVNINF